MKPQVLVTKRIYPEAIEYLKQHCELDDVGDDAGLTADNSKPVDRKAGRSFAIN